MENNVDYGEWRDVSNTLSVSSNGYVKTYCKNHGLRVYVPTTDNGHGYVVFKHGGKSCRFNRLVCETFHGPPPFPGAVADHKNNDRLDNSAGNLHWVTKSENAINVTKVVRRKLGDASEAQDLLPGEQWHTIGRFRVSNMGRARVLKSHSKHPKNDNSWHPIFTPQPQGLSAYARLGKALFHTLVATAFLDPPKSPNMTVDHKNQDKTDNRASNLQWATKKEQIQNRTIVKRASCLSVPVKAFDSVSNSWMRFNSYADAARQLRIRLDKPFYHMNVSKAVRTGKPYNGVCFVRA